MADTEGLYMGETEDCLVVAATEGCFMGCFMTYAEAGTMVYTKGYVMDCTVTCRTKFVLWV